MTPQPEHGHLDLRAPLEKLVTAVAGRLHDVRREGNEPTGPDLVLDVMDSHVSGVLIQEAETAGPSGHAIWHLAHLALALVEQAGIPEHGTGSGPYRRLNGARREVTEALAIV